MSNTRPTPRFSQGNVVQRANQPEAVGIIRDVRWDPQAEGWNYSVQLGGQLRVMPEESLEPLQAVVSAWDSLLQGSVSGARHFVFVMTYHRLRRPPTRIAYSFSTSRTEFYPHQFSPLLKFLDHPGRRLLIADDVGLGKTIEAGYILRELRARQPVERVLVVVPARLVPKWKRELQTRFDEPFEAVRRSELMGVVQRLRQGLEIEPFRWIVSYEQVRAEEVQKGIKETNLPIDVLIVDEAHRLRNPETLQHRAGATLCQVSDVALFLSATPVQNKLEDLWNLLRLLSPEEFGNWELFRSQIDANRPLLLAQKALAGNPARLNAASKNLSEFIANPAGAQLADSEIVRSITTRLRSPGLKGRDLVELRADVSRLSPTGHIITRTRKAEALPHRPKREARWVRVKLTPVERKFYDTVAELCRLVYGLEHGSWGARMAILQAYRMTASSIPSARRYFAERLPTEPIGTVDETMPPNGLDAEEEPTEETELGMPSTEVRARLAAAIAQCERIAGTDSKLERLVEALEGVWRDDERARRPRRKIVVFSTFRRTLAYLREALEARRILNRMIHGEIPVDERELAIDEFLDRDDVLVLLTSEVGGEGIDLQRASVVVNYDLPWNPMVVEQRIGRVDRIGQESPRIVVMSLVVANSIEELILQRLLEKIGVFEESIGELDPIIGDEIQRLTERALRGELVDDELTREVEEAGEALHRRILAAHEMLGRLDGLLAADEAIIDEIHAVTGERQLPTPIETRLFLNEFLGERFPGCQIPEEAVRRVVSLHLTDGLPAAIEGAVASTGLDPQAMARFARRLSGGPVALTLSREVSYRHPRADLLHLRHPLVRFVVSEIEAGRGRIHKAFSLALVRSQVLPAGVYAFAISLVEIHGYRASIKLFAAIVSVDSEREWPYPEVTNRVLLELLDHGEDADVPYLDRAILDRSKDRATGVLSRMVSEWSAREEGLDYARREQQHTAMRTTAEFRLRRVRDRLATLNLGQAAQFSVRMAQAQVDKAQQHLAEVSKQAPVRSWTAAEQEEVAVGFLRVGGG